MGQTCRIELAGDWGSGSDGAERGYSDLNVKGLAVGAETGVEEECLDDGLTAAGLESGCPGPVPPCLWGCRCLR